jgi:hypothetical protein
MCDHKDSALPRHFIEAPDKSPLHKIISDNRRLFTGHALTKGSQILAIGTGPGRLYWMWQDCDYLYVVMPWEIFM